MGKSTQDIALSGFAPNAAEAVVAGRMVSEGETPQDMVARVARHLAEAERLFDRSSRSPHDVADAFGSLMEQGKVVPSTPILTNAGRHDDRPLSACVVPPVSLRGDLARVGMMVDAYHQAGMGSGFNLAESEDPVGVLRYLNDVAVAGAHSGREERPVGNMAILPVGHPAVEAFIEAKPAGIAAGEEWKFNVSVDVPESFVDAVHRNGSWTLDDGRVVDAAALLHRMCDAAHRCGDPGITMLERSNRDNPVPAMGRYVAVAPCAEVALVPGEVCQFAYVNLARFISPDRTGPSLDVDGLQEAVTLLVRVLDNALQLSIAHYPSVVSSRVMAAKRKIGVGVCGLADLLVALGVPYGSPEACAITTDCLIAINYFSKRASVELANERGSYGAIRSPGSVYAEHADYLVRRFGDVDNSIVTTADWADLGRRIAATMRLRHSSTVALPPTGRSAPLIRASTGIEPLFLLRDDVGVLPCVTNYLRTRGHDDTVLDTIARTGHADGSLSDEERAVLRTATECPPADHLRVAVTAQRCVDEAVSKTINMPATATVADIAEIYLEALRSGMKGITVYRDGCRSDQPREL